MTGLEKILTQIGDEAAAGAKLKLDEAQRAADEITAAARQKGEKQAAAIAESSRLAAGDARANAESAAALLKRKELLKVKQELISEVIAKAKERLLALPDDEYFDVILKMVSKFSLPGKGTIIFNKRDLARMPLSFAVKLEAAAILRGGILVPSKETRDIDGGFVLCYDDDSHTEGYSIEQNCSIEAMFYSAREILQDKVNEALFCE